MQNIGDETIDIIGEKQVNCDNKVLMFSDSADYNRLEECISALYKKYDIE